MSGLRSESQDDVRSVKGADGTTLTQDEFRKEKVIAELIETEDNRRWNKEQELVAARQMVDHLERQIEKIGAGLRVLREIREKLRSSRIAQTRSAGQES